MRKLLVAAACVPVFASVALAQAPMETKWHCPKATAGEKYDVGDSGGHAYAIEQGTCNVTITNAGEKSAAFTESLEWANTSFVTRGRMIVTMIDGDKTYYTYDGSGDMAKKSAAIKWKIAGGTGKHTTTKATGSCTGSFNDDGTSDFTCTGTIAPVAAAAPKK